MPQSLYERSLANEVLLPNVEDILERRKAQLAVKRVFDIIFSTAGLIICIPIFLFISIAIKTNSKGPVLFKQIRVGRNGKEFMIFKFRTMIVDAEHRGMQITVGKDFRITGVGHFLRKTKMDELPQLLNVLRGDMSFVGPRPEVPKYVKLYSDYERQILKVRPGITDYASIEYFDENQLLGGSQDPENTYIGVVMVDKFNLNIKYLHNISIIEDIRLILYTLKRVIKNK